MTLQASILYEQPISERIRTFMRLEYYFQQTTHFLNTPSQWGTQVSVLSLMEIVNILERQDIRSDIIKELERNIGLLNRLLNTPQVNLDKLNTTLEGLNEQLRNMQDVQGKCIKSLRQDDLLSTVRQRANLTNTNLVLDNPAFYHWLNQPISTLRQRFSEWLKETRPVQESIELLLNLIRNSVIFENKIAPKGFFQKNLDPQQAHQIIRIRMPADSPYFPEISGGKHRINVRFLQYNEPTVRPKTVEHDVVFELACCGL